MSASAWNPSGQSVQITGITIKSQEYTATAAQSVFAVTNQFTPGQNQLQVASNGLWLRPSQFAESSDGLGFTLATPATVGDKIVARVYTPTTDQFQALATQASGYATAAANSAASAAAVFASIQGLTGTVIGSGNLTFAGTGQLIQGNVGLNITGSIVSGSALSHRNKLVNGCCRIAQRGPVSFTSTNNLYGGADRWLTSISATTVSAVVLRASVGFSVSGYAQQVGNVITTGATLVGISQRLESLTTGSLTGKTITVSAKVLQTNSTNAANTLTIQVNRPNTTDVWSSGQVALGSTTISIPHNIVTPVSFTVTVPDGSKGLSFALIYGSLGAQAVGSQFYFCDMQLEEGSVVTPVEIHPVAGTLMDCLRFYEDIGRGLANDVIKIAPLTNYLPGSKFTVPKFRVPDMKIFSRNGTQAKATLLSSGADVGTSVTAGGVGIYGFFAATDSGSGYVVGTGYEYSYIADAEL